jgi:Cu2+-exporting ATPase
MPPGEKPPQFCCSGCAAAYRLIAGEGLDEYYALRSRFADGQRQPVDAELAELTFVDFDAPRFWHSHVESGESGEARAVLRLQGIHCAACVWLLERLPLIQAGVIDARVNLARATIAIVWDPAQVQLSAIARQIARLGYRVAPLASSQRERQQRALVRSQLIQIAIAGACSGNVMLLALAIYCGQWSGMAAEHLQLLRVASTAVGLVSLLGPGSLFFRGAWSAIRTRTPHMDLPVALGLGVGAISGAWNTLVGSGELYYDSLSMLVFFLLIGRALQAWQQRSACEAVDLLQQLTPATALRVRDGLVETVAIDEIAAGDTLEVRAGQTVPADGQVLQGESEIDASLLTGESLPQPVAVGNQVVAGTLNRSRTLRIQVERVGAKTRLGSLLDAIERAGIQKAPVVQWADRISGHFVRIVLLVAVLVGCVWYVVDREVWSERVIAVLIVACPCALGLATPLAIAVALGQAARRGVLIKGGDALQRLSRPGVLVLDKTGTLTSGRLSVHQWQGSRASLALAAAAEVESPHPVALAIRQYHTSLECESQRPAIGGPSRHGLPDVTGLVTHLGSGVTADVAGAHVVVGNRALMVRSGIGLSEDVEQRVSAIVARGNSPLLVAIDGVIAAVASLGDSLRPEAAGVVARLQQRGWDIRVLSGDDPRIVTQIGDALGLPAENCRGGVSPEAKLVAVRALQNHGQPVIMVGDGVNDAAALAAADVGIAIRGGAEASLQAADVYLAHGSLEGIEDIMASSARTLRVIGRNSVASLLYNVTSVTLASLGWLHPLAAALLMPASSLTVVSVTMWGFWIGQRRQATAEKPQTPVADTAPAPVAVASASASTSTSADWAAEGVLR